MLHRHVMVVHICDWVWAGPEGTGKLHEEVAQMPMVPIPLTLPSLSQPVLLASGGVPYNQLTEEKRLRSGLQMVLHDMQAPPKSGQLHNSPFLGHP